MIINIGTDILEKDRILKALDKKHFINKVYSVNEINIYSNSKNKLASNFVAKEAIVKVLGTGFNGVDPKDIEVFRKNGKPYATLKGTAKDKMDRLKIRQIHLSISHNNHDIIAFAIGED